MARSAEHIRDSLNRMRQLGSALRMLFSALMILTVLLAVCVAMMVALQLIRTQEAELGGIISKTGVSLYIIPAVLWLAIGLSLEGILRDVSDDIARGQSPFTERHATKIAWLGLLFVANAIVALFYRGDVGVDFGAFYFSYRPSPMVLILAIGDGITVDIGSLLVALVCFSVAAMWRYASLLQTQSDDLV